MILSAEKDTILKYLGKHPSRKIIPHLKHKKVFNAKGNSFSPKSIQDIINGVTENINVETEIIHLVATEKEKIQNLENLKKQVL